MWNHIKIIRILKNKIPFRLKLILIRVLVIVQNIWYGHLFRTKKDFGNDKKIFILLSTDYSNLGDHAMTLSQIKLLENNFPEYRIVEILVSDTLKYLQSIRQTCTSEDIITLKGGGNVGLEYFREELIRRKIIKSFPKNRIVMFPQTVYFPDTKYGKKEFYKTVDVFNSHNDFYAFFRDRISYEIMKPYMKQHYYLVPDIVFSLGNIKIEQSERKGAITCLRRDVEGIYSEEDKKVVYKVLCEKYDNHLTITDTIKDYQILTKDRENELVQIWKMIAGAEVVVTDRLHGMIFSALLGTPCIIFNTYNHKLHGQYEWIKDLNYIFNINLDENVLSDTIDKIKELNVRFFEGNRFDEYYERIIMAIKGEL